MDVTDGVEKMEEILLLLKEGLGKIRVGRANPEVLDEIMVDVYETRMPISHLATISVPDVRTIVIQPWDDSNVKFVEKAILASDLGLTPIVDGKLVRLSIPPMTAELREQYIKDMKEKVEGARVSIRGIRHEMMDIVDEQVKEGGVSEDDLKRMKDEIEKEVKRIMEELEEIAETKEEELRTI